MVAALAMNAPCRAARVLKLDLAHLRNYAALRLETDGRPVALTGPNGAGKTNLLEALSFLAPGRGLRGARLEEVQRRGDDAPWAVAARLDGPVEIGTGRDPAHPDRRTVRIDHAAAGSQAALAEHLTVTWLTPSMDRLFQDGASGRRAFLDRLAAGFDPAHRGRAARYEKAMRQRNLLLREGRRDDRWLAGLEAVMAETGTALAAARRELAGRLDRAARQPRGPFPAAGIAMTGQLEDALATHSALKVEDDFRAGLARARAGDAASGQTLAGPHRADLAVRHLEREMEAAACSTGEQKALLLGLTLAHARLVAAERGQAPLLLLDEVAAHLDAARRDALFAELLALGAQAFMTGTDAGLFSPLGDDALRLSIDNARIVAQG